jgi:hypothetical protein
MRRGRSFAHGVVLGSGGVAGSGSVLACVLGANLLTRLIRVAVLGGRRRIGREGRCFAWPEAAVLEGATILHC